MHPTHLRGPVPAVAAVHQHGRPLRVGLKRHGPRCGKYRPDVGQPPEARM